MHATLIINRQPTPVLDGKSPYELLFQKPPPYTQLCTFGCLCYAIAGKLNAHKFSSRTNKCIFLGIPDAQKVYKVYDLNTKRCFVSCDVHFHEGIFLCIY